MAVVVVTTLISLQAEKYVRDNYSQKRVDKVVTELLNFREKLAVSLIEENFNRTAQLLLKNPKKQRQFLVFDQFDNEILGRERLVADTLDKHFSSPLNDEFARRGLALTTTVNSLMGNTYYIRILPQMRFNPWLSPRVSGTILRITLLLLLSAIVCYLLTRTLTRRIQRLQHATHRVANNDFHLDGDLQHFGKDELGKLGQDFHKMAHQLADSERARKQMLSDISHELRSPLARQQVAIEIARTRQAKGDSVTPQLDRMETESERLNELIGYIIHIQKLTLDKNQAELSTVSLDNLLQSIVDDVNFEYQQQQKNAVLSTANKQALTLLGEPELLRSAFENIIRNAMSHTHENTSVSIDLSRDKNRVIIRICDCGDGLLDDSKDIFQPFVRLDSSRNRQTGGYGLGLAIAKAVIQRHNGEVSATNKSDGSGLCVTVVFHLS